MSLNDPCFRGFPFLTMTMKFLHFPHDGRGPDNFFKFLSEFLVYTFLLIGIYLPE